MIKLSAVVIALNEEKNIGDCLEALKFCDEVVVVDSGSRDRTAEIATKMGAKVIARTFTDFSEQKNSGIDHTRGSWLLFIDADERVSSELAAEITRTLGRPSAEAYHLIRKNRIFGRWMKHGANARDLQLRLVKKGAARFEGSVHERLAFRGKAGTLKSPLLHYSTESISAYMEKLRIYAALETREMTRRGQKPAGSGLLRRPLGVFCYRAFIQRGIADGWEGLAFCVLSAYYEFVRRVLHWESTR